VLDLRNTKFRNIDPKDFARANVGFQDTAGLLAIVVCIGAMRCFFHSMIIGKLDPLIIAYAGLCDVHDQLMFWKFQEMLHYLPLAFKSEWSNLSDANTSSSTGSLRNCF